MKRGKNANVCTEVEAKIEIASPFGNEVESFDNAESFSDLVFEIPGMARTFQLHRKILATASVKIKTMLMDKLEPKVEWNEDMSQEIDQKALVKALRFCYGETLSVGVKDGECCALVAMFSRLQVTCLKEVVEKLCSFAIEQSKNDVTVGAKLLTACARYPECCAELWGLNKPLAIAVLTKENMMEHFQEVVDECLMKLPVEYLEVMVYGEPHTRYSEFSIKARYARVHARTMSKEEKQTMLGICNWSMLDSQELRELRNLNVLSKDDLFQAYEMALEYCEIAKEQEHEHAKKFEKERDEFKSKFIKAEEIVKTQTDKYRLSIVLINKHMSSLEIT